MSGSIRHGDIYVTQALEPFHTLSPAGEQSLEVIAAAFMNDPANAEAIAEEKLWDATIGDGLDGTPS